MISIQDVTKIFDKKRALDRVNLSFASAQTHVLLGSSGCGKSTLLRILMGLIEPTQGTVTIEGQAVNVHTQREIAQKIGYVIQDAGLFPHLTAGENVALPMKAMGESRAKINSRLDEVARLVGLDATLLRLYPKELSGGQKQRVGLMRALSLNPTVLLLDEPLGALDPIVRSSLQTELKRIFDTLKKTVVIVTHDLGEAAFFGHSITLMHGGAVLQKGTFHELLKNPADPFVTDFLHAQRPPRELDEIE